MNKTIKFWVECNSPAQVNKILPGVEKCLKYCNKIIITGNGIFKPWEYGRLKAFKKRIIPGMKPDSFADFSELIPSPYSNIWVHDCETYLKNIEKNNWTTVYWEVLKERFSLMDQTIQHWFYPIPPIRTEPGVHWEFCECIKQCIANYRLIDQTHGNLNWNKANVIAHRTNVNINLNSIKPMIPMLFCYKDNNIDWRSDRVLGQVENLKELGYDTIIGYPGQKDFLETVTEIFKKD